MSDKVVVRFLKAWRGYSADELAGFGEEVAEGLKSKGFAEVYEGDGGTASKPKSAKSPASKTGSTKSGGKPSSGASVPKDPIVPPGNGDGGEGDDDTGEGSEGGEGGAGADGEGGDDDEAKP